MKIWLSKNSEVSLREQLTRQIMTAISSGDLQPGSKLPSVRELAIRYNIHQNTVSSAYRWLEENGWVESRKGSGVFVHEAGREKSELVENELDRMTANFFQRARGMGFTDSQIENSLRKFLSNPKPGQILIVEKDEYLREIIFNELQSKLNFSIIAAAPDELLNLVADNSIIVAFPETAEEIRRILPTAKIVSLKINSAQEEIRGQRRPATNELIGIVSGWEMFLRWAKTFLLAVGIESESLVVCDVCQKNFQKSLKSCAFVVTDSATAQILPKGIEKRVFYLLAQDSIEELKSLMEER